MCIQPLLALMVGASCFNSGLTGWSILLTHENITLVPSTGSFVHPRAKFHRETMSLQQLGRERFEVCHKRRRSWILLFRLYDGHSSDRYCLQRAQIIRHITKLFQHRVNPKCPSHRVIRGSGSEVQGSKQSRSAECPSECRLSRSGRSPDRSTLFRFSPTRSASGRTRNPIQPSSRHWSWNRCWRGTPPPARSWMAN
jgi:hypothetical protein